VSAKKHSMRYDGRVLYESNNVVCKRIPWRSRAILLPRLTVLGGIGGGNLVKYAL